jgi:hypothetical protein
LPRVPGTAGRDAVAVAEAILERIAEHRWDNSATGRTGPLATPGLSVLHPPHWESVREDVAQRRAAG